MQIQGSGQVQLADGSRVRLNYADQNGHPYRSIGRWLIDKGELKAEQASMQGIKAWAKANPARLAEMLNANPSLVFFRELPVDRQRTARRHGSAADAGALARRRPAPRSAGRTDLAGHDHAQQ
jgi:membrane-bound lytic murein transglycosylase A